MDRRLRLCFKCKKTGPMINYSKITEIVKNKFKDVYSGQIEVGSYVCTQCLLILRSALKKLPKNNSNASQLLQIDSSYNINSQSYDNAVGIENRPVSVHPVENLVLTPIIDISNNSDESGAAKRSRLTVAEPENIANEEINAVHQNDDETVENVGVQASPPPQQEGYDIEIELTTTDNERQAEARMREMDEARKNARIRIRDNLPPNYILPQDRLLQLGNYKRTSGG